MSPLRGEEFTGRTVEEAIERGLHQLGRRRDQVDIEILEKGKPANMLGIGGEDARVLLTFNDEAREEELEAAPDEAEVPRRPDAAVAADEGDEAPPAFREELAIGETVLREMLEVMGVQAEVELQDEKDHEGLEVLGPELGALIGRGGENLIALQQVVSAITSRRVGRTVHVPVDVEGYRRRREEQLRDIARRVAARVRSSGQAMTLEPMLAYERRIVHLAVQQEPGIRTESVGVEPNRRVVIASTAPGARGPAPMRRPAPPASGGMRRSGPPSYGPRRGFGPRPGGFRPRPGGGGGSWDRSR